MCVVSRMSWCHTVRADSTQMHNRNISVKMKVFTFLTFEYHFWWCCQSQCERGCDEVNDVLERERQSRVLYSTHLQQRIQLLCYIMWYDITWLNVIGYIIGYHIYWPNMTWYTIYDMIQYNINMIWKALMPTHSSNCYVMLYDML